MPHDFTVVEGGTLVLCLADKDPAAVWQVDVDVLLGNGRFRLGSVATAPTAGGPSTRCILFADVPGAEGWRIRARLAVPGPRRTADLTWSVEPRASGHSPGLFAVAPFATKL